MEFLLKSLGMTFFQFFRYAVFAGGFYAVFYVWKKKSWFHKKIKQAYPANDKVWFEIKHSLISLLIFGLVGGIVIAMRDANLTLMYDDFSEYSLTYFFTSIILFIVLHDTYFYWTHRLMHHPKLFAKVHGVHHQSHNPTPWAAFSFHPIEAVVEAGIFPLGVILIPMHNYAVLIFMVYMIFMNVMGHLGFEILPKRFEKSMWFIFSNTSTHHYMHHRYSKCNYGLYFNIWDRLMKTNHKKYEKLFQEVSSRKPISQTETIEKNELVNV